MTTVNNMLTPGVQVSVDDESTYTSNASSSVLAIVGTSTKGPLTPTLVTTPRQFIQTFGNASDKTYGPGAALDFLTQGNQLYYKRIVRSSKQASAGTVGTDKLTFSAVTAGVEGNNLSVQLTMSGSDSTATAEVDVLQGSSKVETFTDLSQDPDNANYVAKVVNAQSKLVNVTINSTGSLTTKTYSLTGGISGGAYAVYKDNNLVIQSLTYDSTLNGAKVVLSSPDYENFFDYTLVDPNGNTLESFVSVTFDSSNARYLPSVLNQYSNFISIEVLAGPDKIPSILNESYALAGGDDGTNQVSTTDYIGDELSGTGIYALSNKLVYAIDLFMIPGITDETVIQAGISMCESRGDCVYLVDVPFGLNAQDTTDWTNGQGAWLGKHAAFDSDSAAFFAPWGFKVDAITGNKTWVPSSAMVAPRFAYTNATKGVGYAPAGPTRGKITTVTGLERSFTQGESDLLYGNRNIVNPILDMGTYGIVIDGQKTAKRTPTSLDRINVKLLVNYIKRQIEVATRAFTFEPNNSTTYTRWQTVVEPMLDNLKNSNAITEYKVQMDDTTVDDYDRETGIMPGVVSIKPIKSAEFIPISIRIDPQSIIYKQN